MNRWVSLFAIDDIPRQGARVVRWDGTNIAVFRTAVDEVFALRDECPHRRGPLSEGIVHGGRVTYPLHNWVVDLDCGGAVAPDEGCVTTYPVRIEHGVVRLRVA